LAFVGGGGAGAYAVAWEFGDEEGGVWFPGLEDLRLVGGEQVSYVCGGFL
jgi:hypothetical protein